MGLAMSCVRPARGAGVSAAADPVELARSVFGDPGGARVDLGERWQALHYLLTGDPWDGDRPAADLVCGGVLLTVDDEPRARLGGDVLYLTPDRVAAASAHLVRTPAKELLRRFDPVRMKELEIAGNWSDADLDALRVDRAALDELYASAAADGAPVLKLMR